MKKLLAILLAAVMVVSLAACGGSGDAATKGDDANKTTAEGGESAKKSSKDQLIYANYQDCPTFDPIQDTNGTMYREFVFDHLWYLESDGSYTPKLATEWNWKDDLNLEITLREGVTFSNGNAFTADDVIFSLQRYKDGPMGQYYANIEKMEKTDDTHMTIQFNVLPSVFMVQNGTSMGFIMDKEYTEANADNIDTQPMGTSCYVLDNWTVGDSCTFKANESYWGEKPLINTVIVRVIAEATQRMIELQSGGVDVACQLNFSDSAALEGAGLKVLSTPSNIVQTLFLNTVSSHKLANEQLRQALMYCIDREAVTKGVTNGAGISCYSVVAPATPGFNKEMEAYSPYAQDFDKAKELLAQAGYPNGVELDIVYNDKPSNNSEVEILQNQFAQAGITLNVTKGDFSTALGIALDREGKWDIFLLGNGGVSAPINFQFYDRAQGAPFAKLVDEDALALIDKVYATTDQDAQFAAGNEVQKYMADHVLSVPLYADLNVFGYTPDLEGVTVDAGGNTIPVWNCWFK